MLKAREEIVWRVVDGETLLLDTQSGDYFSLNGTGTEIWNLVAQGMTRDEVAQKLVERYDLAFDDAARDVDALVEDLVSQQIVEQ